MFNLLEKAADVVVPGWAKWAAIALAGVTIYFLGQLHGERVAGQAHIDYVMKQASQTVKIAQAQAKIVTVTQTVVQEKIRKIYVQGEKIETVVHDLVVPLDDARYSVNIGFVRAYNAAWAGELVGSPNDFDREPAEVDLSAIASAEAKNATIARAWRQQAFCWSKFYRDQQVAINGVEPGWYKPAPDETCELIQGASEKDQALPPAQ